MPQATLETIGEQFSRPDIPDDVLAATLEGLKARYDESQRRYHTFEHPLELFDILLEHLKEVRDPEVIGWAIMYHDAVYDPTATGGSNEELSAQLGEQELPRIIGDAKTRRVAQYTRATAKHEIGDRDSDLDFFLDADLVILGADPARYRRYAHDIRDEYRHVPDELYIPARIGILEDLGSRVAGSGLFRTELFRALYENAAQENIAAEVEALRSQS